MKIDISALRHHLTQQTQFNRSDFSYNYPDHLVAQSPAAKRTASRLLVRYSNGKIIDSHFSELTQFLRESKPLIIRNSSRVIRARLFGKTDTGAQCEIFLLEPQDTLDFSCLKWQALGRPLKRLPAGKTVTFSDNLTAVIEGATANSEATPTISLTFSVKNGSLVDAINAVGQVPLPPYIRRSQETANYGDDAERYQTVYSNEIGSVAAPTAGLHFDKDIEQKLIDSGCDFANCVLHVGAGTFLPVKSQNINEHDMHSECYSFSEATVEAIIHAHENGRLILCVGTTSFRALESFALLHDGDYQKMRTAAGKFQSTNLFIRPQDSQNVVRPALTKMMITNFHQPESTLIMLIAALIGFDAMKDVYKHAVENNYRLFSYGDSCLFFLD